MNNNANVNKDDVKVNKVIIKHIIITINADMIKMMLYMMFYGV